MLKSKTNQDYFDEAVVLLKECFPGVEWAVGEWEWEGVKVFNIEGKFGGKFLRDTPTWFWHDEVLEHGKGIYERLLSGQGWNIVKKRKNLFPIQLGVGSIC